MSDNCNEITSVLKRGGTNQAARYDAALNPDLLKLQGFGIKEWMQFAYNFAKDVKYFSTENDLVSDGNWQDFFKNDAELKELLANYEKSDKLTPHLTLFICFLKLIQMSTDRFNDLTKRHLDFYYAEVLHITKLPETADKVYVLFELAKNIAQEKLPAGTMLDGGKDATGKTRGYGLTDELVANKAKVVQLKNVYNNPDNGSLLSNPIKAAPVANSADGQGEAFAGSDVSWYPFGYEHTQAGRPELPDARIGFALSSSALNLSEGKRNVVVQVLFSDVLAPVQKQELIDNIEVFYTNEKGWSGPLKLSDLTVAIDENTGTDVVYKTGLSSKTLTLLTFLDTGAEAVVNYDAAIHGENFNTSNPVFRFIVKTNTPAGYNIYKNMCTQINKIGIRVDVKGVKKLVLESDTGTLNAQNPFYPFTTNPVKGSSFSFYNAEIANKKWKTMDVKIHWKNTPDSFNDLYRAYDKNFLGTVSKKWFLDIQVAAIRPVQRYFLPNINLGFYDRYNSIVTGDNYFRANTSILYKESWNFVEANVVLFTKMPPVIANEIEFETHFSIRDAGYEEGKTGPVRLSLQQSFLHDLFPRIYALAMMNTSPDTIVPNQPYTPFADDISVDYSASDELVIVAQTQEEFNHRTVKLFHEHPYGQAEENLYLKKQFNSALANCQLTPTYCKGGELYIGLENAENLQQVSLLIQVMEGTENTLIDSFSGNQRVTWDILCSNQWKTLDSALMLVNEVDNFLKSGLVKFTIPREATSDNTLLPGGLFWVRAKMMKHYDAVCRVLGINAQAGLAVFDNHDNELSHLEKGIADKTISKLVQRLATVKGVTQPFNSFGGKPQETDEQYYRRVSERLRHKNRAITLWDYEKIILQQFPEIYKVKCLNHTCQNSFLSAGNVTVVVIPDTIRKNVFDLYQPRVSQALLNEIGNYVSQLNSLHAKTNVINPDYEEVMVSLKVKFYDGFDPFLYKQELNKDITKFLSPWAFELEENIQFGVSLHLSVLIDYIEKLKYVDYLQDVKLIQHGNSSLKVCTPSSPKSILVSAKRHDISTDIKTCSTSANPATEICQL